MDDTKEEGELSEDEDIPDDEILKGLLIILIEFV
jgi:hypothetical protein